MFCRPIVLVDENIFIVLRWIFSSVFFISNYLALFLFVNGIIFKTYTKPIAHTTPEIVPMI